MTESALLDKDTSPRIVTEVVSSLSNRPVTVTIDGLLAYLEPKTKLTSYINQVTEMTYNLAKQELQFVHYLRDIWTSEVIF